MKKYSLLFLSSVLFLLASCADQSDSADEKKSDDSDTSINTRTTPPPTPAQEYSGPPAKVEVEEVQKDTPRTSISIGKDGARVKTKKGTDVSYDKEGIKVGSKKVKIDIKRDSL